MRSITVLLTALVLPIAASATLCFTVLSPQGRVVHQSTASPLDLSDLISQELQDKYPNHHFVFGEDKQCRSVGEGDLASSAGTVAQASNEAVIAAMLSRYPSTLSSESYNAYSQASQSWNYGFSRSAGSQAGTEVNVRGYSRRDGTYVPAHTRAAPGRRR